MLDSKTKNVFLLIAFLSIFIEARAITLEQFGRTLNFVHDTCQTKTKVSEETLVKIRGGDFVEDAAAKCYTHCFMEMLHLMEGVNSQFHVANQHTDYIIPAELFVTTIKAFGHCEDATKGMSDPCEAAYTMLKCFKADNPEFWFK